MPPEENKNSTNLNFDPLKVKVDPVFKTSQNTASTPNKVSPSAYNVLNNQQYTPSQNKTLNQAANEVLKTINNPDDPNLEKKSLIRTYKGDLEKAIQADHLSSINIAVAENEKMHSKLEKGEVVSAPEAKGDYSLNKIIIFLSVVLIILGVAGVSFVYLFKNNNSEQIIKVQELPSVITSEYKDELKAEGMSRAQFIKTLSDKLNLIEIPVNNFYNTYITVGTSTARRLITAEEFVSFTELKMPDQIKRTLAPDYMVGMFVFGKNLPFIIFKTSYFENAYAGMFIWEKDLEKDLQVLFRLDGAQLSGGLAAELTPTTARIFEDGVVVNKDVRLVKDDAGETMLLYAIIDKETIVITVNENAFKEIVNRLNKEKGLKR